MAYAVHFPVEELCFWGHSLPIERTDALSRGIPIQFFPSFLNIRICARVASYNVSTIVPDVFPGESL